jgi:hypothetical protein
MTRLTIATFLCLAGLTAGCTKPKLAVEACDLDLGYVSTKMHLANVQYLGEDRSPDWFELYQNLEMRRSNRPAASCIPGKEVSTLEQNIERREHSLKNLR